MIAKHRHFSMSDRDESAKKNWLGIGPVLYQQPSDLLNAVDAFLTELGPERIIAINWRESEYEFVCGVVVWYWESS